MNLDPCASRSLKVKSRGENQEAAAPSHVPAAVRHSGENQEVSAITWTRSEDTPHTHTRICFNQLADSQQLS